MSVPNHGILGVKQGRHATLRMTFPTAADRLSDKPSEAPARFEYPFADDDIGTVARDIDTGAVFMLTSATPVVWSSLVLLPDPTSIDISIVKATAGTIAAGDVVRLVGYNVTEGFCTGELAKSDSPSTMPGFGIAVIGATDTVAGTIRITGLIQGIDTSAFSEGDLLYVSETVSGGLQNTKPQPTDRVQPIAQVCRVDAVNGSVLLTGTSRATALPNTPSIALNSTTAYTTTSTPDSNVWTALVSPGSGDHLGYPFGAGGKEAKILVEGTYEISLYGIFVSTTTSANPVMGIYVNGFLNAKALLSTIANNTTISIVNLSGFTSLDLAVDDLVTIKLYHNTAGGNFSANQHGWTISLVGK